jgi:hypothetical protein
MIERKPGLLLIFPLILILSGPLEAAESQVRSVSSFDNLRASGLLEVYLTKGTDESVRVVAEGTSLDEVVTENDGKTLVVRMKHGILYNEDEVKVKVYVTYGLIRDISIVTGAKVISEQPLRGDKISIDMTTGGKGTLSLEVNTADLRIVKGSVLTLSGRSESIDATVNTSSELHAYGLTCDRVFIAVNSGGIAEVLPLKEIEGSAGTGGVLYVKGNPLRTSYKKSLGGSVKEVQ